MNDLPAKVMKNIRRRHLFGPGDTVVVAVSGGADSVALLGLLATLPDSPLHLVVAHLNHRLRGAEADGDEAFVRNLAGRYGVAVETGFCDVREVAKQERRSLEDAGRVARSRFLAEVAQRHGATCIALAHHADDQAETFLLRLLRGAAGSGLAGMAPKSPDGRLVRPLLGVTRQEIEAYLAERGLAWRTDSSNTDRRFLRNRVRHDLLPQLASYNPRIGERLAATAAALAADEELLAQLTRQRFAELARGGEGAVTLSLEPLRQELPGLRLRLLREAIRQTKGDLARISGRHLAAVDALAQGPTPQGELHLPGVTVTRSYDFLAFSPPTPGALETGYQLTVGGPGDYPLPGGGRLVLREADLPFAGEELSERVAWFDRELAPFPWTIRTFQPGDRIVLPGLAGRKKVKELFAEHRLPMATRRRLPLLCSDATLLWVCGMRRGAAARLSPASRSGIRAELLDFPL